MDSMQIIELTNFIEEHGAECIDVKHNEEHGTNHLFVNTTFGPVNVLDVMRDLAEGNLHAKHQKKPVARRKRRGKGKAKVHQEAQAI